MIPRCCETCLYWEHFDDASQYDGEFDPCARGTCRRYPPVLLGAAPPDPTPHGDDRPVIDMCFTGRPHRRADDWCGEYREDRYRFLNHREEDSPS